MSNLAPGAVKNLAAKANRAARAGHCRAAITWMGMTWRAYGATYGNPTGPQRGAKLLRPLARMQTEIMTACNIPEKQSRKALSGVRRRR